MTIRMRPDQDVPSDGRMQRPAQWAAAVQQSLADMLDLQISRLTAQDKQDFLAYWHETHAPKKTQ